MRALGCPCEYFACGFVTLLRLTQGIKKRRRQRPPQPESYRNMLVIKQFEIVSKEGHLKAEIQWAGSISLNKLRQRWRWTKRMLVLGWNKAQRSSTSPTGTSTTAVPSWVSSQDWVEVEEHPTSTRSVAFSWPMSSQHTQLFSCTPDEMQYNCYIPLPLSHVTPIYTIFLYMLIGAQRRLLGKQLKRITRSFLKNYCLWKFTQI